jgi:hypothetical protein
MKYRHLRIAFSCACGIACVLLVVLWVRSYSIHSSKSVWVTPNYRYYLRSTEGKAILLKQERIFFQGLEGSSATEWTFAGWKTFDGPKVLRDLDGSVRAVSFPYWLLASMPALLAAFAWMVNWRFSLRNLLIATTLVAVALGLIVATLR